MFSQKKKDPNAPKKPLSAYMFFCADHRDQIKKDNPEMKVTEVTSELGKVWGTMDEVRQRLDDQARSQLHDSMATASHVCLVHHGHLCCSGFAMH